MNSEMMSEEHIPTKYDLFLEKHGWSGSTLKIIAAVTMLIDHIGATMEWYIVQNIGTINYTRMNLLDNILRGIGRMAFPIFCFLLVEGFLHTKSAGKYLIRLCVFALISEIPFDLCFFRETFHWNYQNVYFTLAIGLAMLMLLKKVEELAATSGFYSRYGAIANYFLIFISNSVIVMAACIFASFLKTDYGSSGIATIAIMYFLRKTRILQLVGTLIADLCFLFEVPALACLIPIAMYNGKRGLKMKYFFYVFYPAHILLLWIGSRLLGVM